jgi:hypothetical protein
MLALCSSECFITRRNPLCLEADSCCYAKAFLVNIATKSYQSPLLLPPWWEDENREPRTSLYTMSAKDEAAKLAK